MKFMGLWTVHICTVHDKKSTFAVTVHWTVTAIPKTREKKKKKTKRNKTQLGNAEAEYKHTHGEERK